MMQYRNKQLIRAKTRKAHTYGLGPASYDPADHPTLTFNDLRSIDTIEDVNMFCDDCRYIPRPYSVAANVLAYVICVGTAGSSHEARHGDDFSAVTFKANARGE
jgi:hypothetical protein